MFLCEKDGMKVYFLKGEICYHYNNAEKHTANKKIPQDASIKRMKPGNVATLIKLLYEENQLKQEQCKF